MSPREDERGRRGSDTEPPSGVHRRLGRLVVIEPDRSARGGWDLAAEVHHVEFVKGPNTLPHALRQTGTLQAVSVALPERHRLERRAGFVQQLVAVTGLGGLRVVIDGRRCDVESALELLDAGFILCADDEAHRGTAARAAVGRRTMLGELADGTARRRLAKTIGATHVADQHDLSGGEFRALRSGMDCSHLAQLARAMGRAESTMRSQAQRICKKAGASTFRTVVREAEDAAYDAAFVLGRVKL
jgi:hypothetical protein